MVLAAHFKTIDAREGMTPADDYGEMLNPGFGSSEGQQSGYHLPVMPADVIQGLVVAENGVYLDGTLGEGGHSLAILQAEPEPQLVAGIDLDGRSVAAAAARLSPFGTRFLALRGNYADMVSLMADQGVRAVDGVLLDLGFSSRQIDQPGYGLSFRSDEPLDMRYDAEQSLDAAAVVNSSSELELAAIFRTYGEEPRAQAIARAIVRERSNKSLSTAGDLASLVERVSGRGRGRRIHPATRVFQAIRIAVNRELDNLKAGLESAVELLAAGGRLAVISYHSLEDRIVKNFLSLSSVSCVCPPGLPECVCGHIPTVALINRRVIRPSVEEVASNPRSRSARLRVARKI